MRPDESDTIINARDLRRTLGDVVRAARRGRRYTVIYRSRPAFRIVPVDAPRVEAGPALEDDPLYGAGPLGRSDAGDLADRHDEILYGPES